MEENHDKQSIRFSYPDRHRYNLSDCLIPNQGFLAILSKTLLRLVKANQVNVELGIWILVVVLPILAPPTLVLWLIVRLVRRKSTKQAVSARR